MMSRLIFSIHTVIFLAFVGLSLASPFFVFLLPWSMVWWWVGGTILFGIAVISSWRIWGECPFTVWENIWRKHEGRPVYRGACTEHYARVFGLHMRPGISTPLLEVLPLFPIAAALLKFFI
jgi:hypothetical protein